MSTPGRCRGDERGTGVVATMMVVPLVLVLVLFATQVLLRLHTRARVAASAHAAARDVGVDAASPSAATARAGQDLRAELGREAEIEWWLRPDRVEVRVRLPAPRLLAIGAFGALGPPIEVAASSPVEGWR
jgi:hypothetical protein